MIKTEIYVPVGAQTTDALTVLDDYICDYGGCSKYRVDGTWEDKTTGEIVEEPVDVYVFLHEGMADWYRIIDALHDAGEKEVLIVESITHGKFYANPNRKEVI